MPAKRTPTTAKKNKARRRTCRVLLVEASPERRKALEACGTAHRPMSVVHAPTLTQARKYLADHSVDLAVIAPQLPDGSGFDLTAELTRMSHTTAKIVIGVTEDFSKAQQALRAGADDYIVDGLEFEELSTRVAEALDRKTRDKAHVQRVERLRRLCKKLNAAREEVSKQVDILCNDLVTAYQELACQMQNVVQTSEFDSVVQDELDLEALLRKTLEHLMAKLGPANAAIFLPATMDEYSLGGYVNYDCTKESADMLLQQLADSLAPRVAAHQDMIHLTEREAIERWIGQDAGMLGDSELLAVPCMHDDECLAVLVLFRDVDQPFVEEHLDRVSALGPLMGESLERIIRVHHRSLFDPEDAESYGESYSDDADNPFGVDMDDDYDDELPF
ncbi:response regulator [Algisphaera agarilytica]|uniref:DNA-binding response OmpR family regulator n=1 Tax=Algisphaera agarilytica TaxID=1385975 RepID=A0A7X0LKV3_9BACT|nr:response regulator [Algisphaera agarilytica]MBB6430006.1 DNA-binding response OmpR family regulator [Algisphaera agarilytica]